MQSLLDEKFVKFKESFQAHDETTFQSGKMIAHLIKKHIIHIEI